MCGKSLSAIIMSGEKIMTSKERKYYIQFDERLPLSQIPSDRLPQTGTWARISGTIYEGSSKMSAKELESFLCRECDLPKSSFQVIPYEDGIMVRR